MAYFNFVMIDKGILEIDGNRTKVDRQDIRKLKLILDELGIMHIVDGVPFRSTCHGAWRKEAIHDCRLLGAEKDGSVPPKNRVTHEEQTQFRELKIPNFRLIDFISLTQLDDEEAELLGDLVCGTRF